MPDMNRLSNIQVNLPIEPEDLARFILVGREKLVSIRAEIRAIDRLQLAQEVREQKRDEARMLSEALLDAEVRIGQLLKKLPKGSGGDHGNQHTGGKTDTGVDFAKSTKAQAIEAMGFTSKQAERFEILASHPDVVEQVKTAARENDDLPTRTAVINLVKYKQKKEAAAYRQIDEDARLAQLLTKALSLVEQLPTDEKSIAAMCRGSTIVREGTLQSLSTAISALTKLQHLIMKGGS